MERDAATLKLGLMKNRMRNTLAIISLTVLTFFIATACKDPILGPTYPITDFSEYDVVVIATVDHETHSTEGYQELETFDLTIKKCLKGNLTVDDKISGKAKTEEAHAVCPVHLSEGADYLLLLTKPIEGYRLSRFSIPVKRGHAYFDNYIAQIEKILNSSKNH